MRLRPAKALWFETFVPRDETVFALEALAATGAVELEADPRLAAPMDLAEVRRSVERFRSLARQFGNLLPHAEARPQALLEAPERTAETALQRLTDWAGPVDALRVRQMQLETERQNLLLLYECLAALHEASRDIARLAHRSKFLYKGVFACPHEHHLQAEICAAIDEFVPGLEHDFFIVADLPDQRQVIEQAYRNDACLRVEIPAWLPPEPEHQRPAVSRRIHQTEQALETVGETLDERTRDPDVRAAAADMALLSWYVDNACELGADRRLCHVSGWTTQASAQALQQAFDAVGVHAVIRIAVAPVFSRPPVSLTLPPWARPFRLFVEMLGTPDSAEIDPANLLPVIVPLLFGYMFPDLGHGLLLAVISLVLWRRWADGRFLLPCGLSAAAFGVVFGEVFGVEGVLEPLWFKPMAEPLRVLAVPMLFGAGLLLTGLIFNGLQAFWRDELRVWTSADAPVLLVYGSALAGLFCLPCLWAAAAALVWFAAAQALSHQRDCFACLMSNLGRLLQDLLELGLNTFSFLRVGAFALAHAGLSIAILQLAEGIETPVARALFLVVGHGLIIAVEGLVVFVQTTRLVLFEFFIRFLRAEGRLFRPLPAPERASVPRADHDDYVAQSRNDASATK